MPAPYGSLAVVKEILAIPATNTAFDTELNNIRSEVSRRVDIALKRHTSLPLATEIETELGDIVNLWTAGVYRSRKGSEGLDGRNFTNEAQDRLEELIEGYFRGTFVRSDQA